MTVQPPDLYPLSVQIQPTCHELNGTETKPQGLFVQHPVWQTAGAGPDQPYRQCVEEGMVQAPGVDTVQRAGDGQCQLAGIYSFGPGGAADLGLEGAATVSPTVEE